MKVFGLTGGIGAGKSTVSSYWNSKFRLPIIDGDLIAREIVEPGTPCLKLLIKQYSKDILLDDGKLNRNLLGNIIFSSSSERKIVENIMAKFMDERTNEVKLELTKRGFKFACYDAALIIEHNLIERYRPLVLITTSRETQVARVMKRNNFSLETAMKRVASQMTSEKQLKFADFIINNEGSKEELLIQANLIYNEITK